MSRPSWRVVLRAAGACRPESAAVPTFANQLDLPVVPATQRRQKCEADQSERKAEHDQGDFTPWLRSLSPKPLYSITPPAARPSMNTNNITRLVLLRSALTSGVCPAAARSNQACLSIHQTDGKPAFEDADTARVRRRFGRAA